jgi:hypothetical protein
MITILSLAALLAAAPVPAACQSAAPVVVAAARRSADEAALKAQEAESIAVRSGNPGAARRATLARQEADEALRKVAALACEAAPTAAARKPAIGY